jgi:hypothetical protein
MWYKPYLLMLSGILLAASARADVLPYVGDNSRHYSWFELSVRHLPPGMVILFLDQDDRLRSKGGEKNAVIIDEGGTLYLAREKQLSVPFSFSKDKAKLHKLRSLVKGELPSRNHPLPVICTVTVGGPNGYKMKCAGL